MEKQDDNYKNWGKAARIASFPSHWFYGRTLKREVVISITRRAKLLVGLGRWAYYHKSFTNSGYYDHIHCWIGIESYLSGSRNWDICGGVNNPFLINRAIITN